MELLKLDDGRVSVAAAARWSAYRVPSRVPSGAQILPPKAYSVGDLAKAPATHALSHIESPRGLGDRRSRWSFIICFCDQRSERLAEVVER